MSDLQSRAVSAVLAIRGGHGLHEDLSDLIEQQAKRIAELSESVRSLGGYIAELEANGTVQEALAWREKAEQLRSEAWKAHVPVTNEQHDPQNGLLSGFCERCRTPWPCDYSPEKRVAETRP